MPNVENTRDPCHKSPFLQQKPHRIDLPYRVGTRRHAGRTRSVESVPALACVVAPQPGDVKEGSGPVMASWTSTSDIFRHVTCCTHQLTEQPQESGKRQQAPNPPTGVFLCLSPVSSPSEKTPMTGPAAVRLDAIS